MFTSVNDITFAAMEQGASLFSETTFAMDRRDEDNKIFLKLNKLKQDYVIRVKSNRKLLLHNKRLTASELCNHQKGKIKMKLIFYT